MEPVTGDAAAATARYTRTAVWLHWIIAAAIALNLGSGLFCAASETTIEPVVMNLHKALGLIVLGLSLIRLAWRLTHRPPALPFASTWQRRSAGWVHAGLYGLMMALPLTGWLVTSSFPGRHPIRFGLFEVPYLPVSTNLPRAIFAHGVHAGLALSLGVLLAGHVIAALRHQLVLKDNLLDRMRLG